MDPLRDPGVVHEQVDATVTLERLPAHRLDRVAVADVDDCGGRLRCRSTAFLDHFVEELLAARGGDDRDAPFREVQGDRLPDPRGRAGHDRHLAAVVETHAGAYRSRRICAMRSRWKDAPPNATS